MRPCISVKGSVHPSVRYASSVIAKNDVTGYYSLSRAATTDTTPTCASHTTTTATALTRFCSQQQRQTNRRTIMTVVFSYYWTIFGIPWNSFFFLPLLICHACFFLSFLLYSLIFSSFSLFSMSSYFLKNSICVFKPGSQVRALCRGQDDADNDDADYNAALWVGTIKSTHSIHRHRPLSHELQSERVSKRANKWAQRSTRAKRAVRCKRLNAGANGPELYASIS